MLGHLLVEPLRRVPSFSIALFEGSFTGYDCLSTPSPCERPCTCRSRTGALYLSVQDRCPVPVSPGQVPCTCRSRTGALYLSVQDRCPVPVGPGQVPYCRYQAPTLAPAVTHLRLREVQVSAGEAMSPGTACYAVLSTQDTDRNHHTTTYHQVSK
jgi:hypothetical protein